MRGKQKKLGNYKPPTGPVLEYARDLRQSMTDAEALMWDKLRSRRFEDLKFRRQHPIPPYIADFFCEELGLIIELDGGQHTEDKDHQRTKFLEAQGYQIIRFWNNDVLNNIEGVMTKIKEETSQQTPPHPSPLPEGEGTKRICLGEISTAHGVRGLVRVRVYGDDPQALTKYGPLFTSESGDKTIAVKMKNAANKFWIAEIAGVTDRNVAETLRGTKLWIEREKLPALEDDDEVYYEDLIGMTIKTTTDDNVGVVVAVENFGASDLLEVKPPVGSTFYLPYADEYIVEVNLPAKTITAEIPEGLRN